MALERILPRYDASERHAIVVRADPARTYAALRALDLADLPLTRALMALRALPDRLRHRRGIRLRRHVTLDGLRGAGFALLSEEPGREIVLGLAGRFWSVTGGGMRVTADDFASFSAPGTAKAAMDFRLEPLADGRTRLSTETRILCADEAARRSFGPYWFAVRAGSGLIRREILARVKRAAER